MNQPPIQLQHAKWQKYDPTQPPPFKHGEQILVALQLPTTKNKWRYIVLIPQWYQQHYVLRDPIGSATFDDQDIEYWITLEE